MSAAYWRRAMNTGADARMQPRPPTQASVVDRSASATPRWLEVLQHELSVRHVVILAGVLIYPFVASPFFTYQIGAQALALGLIALSLTFLGGYGGMVSLAQMTVAGFAAYMLAIFGVAGEAQGGASSLGWPWWI